MYRCWCGRLSLFLLTQSQQVFDLSSCAKLTAPDCISAGEKTFHSVVLWKTKKKYNFEFHLYSTTRFLFALDCRICIFFQWLYRNCLGSSSLIDTNCNADRRPIAVIEREEVVRQKKKGIDAAPLLVVGRRTRGGQTEPAPHGVPLSSPAWQARRHRQLDEVENTFVGRKKKSRLSVFCFVSFFFVSLLNRKIVCEFPYLREI